MATMARHAFVIIVSFYQITTAMKTKIKIKISSCMWHLSVVFVLMSPGKPVWDVRGSMEGILR